jgi:hypothetical protein
MMNTGSCKGVVGNLAAISLIAARVVETVFLKSDRWKALVIKSLIFRIQMLEHFRLVVKDCGCQVITRDHND